MTNIQSKLPSMQRVKQTKGVTLFFYLILYLPVNNLSVRSGRVFLGLTITKLRLICLAQGHNAVTPVMYNRHCNLQTGGLFFLNLYCSFII